MASDEWREEVTVESCKEERRPAIADLEIGAGVEGRGLESAATRSLENEGLGARGGALPGLAVLERGS